jgi:uncharacterized protein
MPATIKQVADGVEIAVKVVPGASRDRIVGPLGDALKVQVAAAPERGKANAAVEALLADALGVPIKSVRVTRGHSSPRKTVVVQGITADDAGQRLGIR